MNMEIRMPVSQAEMGFSAGGPARGDVGEVSFLPCLAELTGLHEETAGVNLAFEESFELPGLVWRRQLALLAGSEDRLGSAHVSCRENAGAGVWPRRGEMPGHGQYSSASVSPVLPGTSGRLSPKNLWEGKAADAGLL